MTDYCTLQDAKNELKADTTVGDALLRRAIKQVSSRIDSMMGSNRRPYFAPYTEQRQFLVAPHNVDSYYNVLWLRDNLLSFSAVVLDTLTITTNVVVYPPYPSPHKGLRFTARTYYWYSQHDDYDPVYCLVTGVWGWHEDYTNAWASVDVLEDANLTASASNTTVNVNNADGADLDGFTPRFSPGNLIKINSEWMEVTATDTTANTLTVRRAANGTALAAHTIGDAVSVFMVDERIRRVTARQAALLFSRRGAFQVETLDGVGAITYPQDMLVELRVTLQEFVYG